ncbi:MAG TPA: ABC transporter ATP-binding protein [Hydrogenophaga sp.]|nr:ABC transporter ATP-binding protein [Hydrogenophaga sp.]
MASISIRGMTKRFGAITAVEHLDLEVNDGEFFVLLGPSGAGKTTTLRLIAGLERPDAGQIHMDGQDISGHFPAARDCAFVFQQYSLYPHLSVYDNIAFPLRSPMRKTPEAKIRERVHEVASLLHIESKLERKATALSGGEMQRVAIGRALVRSPKVFLMDEPLSSLDARLREELRVELKRIQKDTGSTVIYVTHDQVEATTLADRIGILEAGKVQQVGTPLEIYESPATLQVAQRLGSPVINALPAIWAGLNAPNNAVHAAIRPEDVQVARGDDALVCRVIEASLLKHEMVVERDGIEIHVHTSPETVFHPGDMVSIRCEPARCLYFDARGQRISSLPANHPSH